LEVPRGILCILESSSWDFVHFWKFLVGLYIFQSSSWDCVHLGSSSWDFVHYSKSIMGFCAFSEVPHGILCIYGISSWQSIHMSISSFHFFSTKYVFLQHAYWLIAAIAGCNQFKMSYCNHAYLGNTAKVDTDRNICLAKMSLIRTKPDHFYDMIWFFTYILF
jgi:hypothetical protein